MARLRKTLGALLFAFLIGVNSNVIALANVYPPLVHVPFEVDVTRKYYVCEDFIAGYALFTGTKDVLE